jgi:hypothetical protein
MVVIPQWESSGIESRLTRAFSEAGIWRLTCTLRCMILLVTPAAKAQDCAVALQQATTEVAQVAGTLRQALTKLRAQEYSAVVVDQFLLEGDANECEIVMQHIGMAIPIYVNFAISGIDRVVRELRSTLHRHQNEVAAARKRAEYALRSELRGTVTALLLSCELVLEVPGLPQAAQAKVRQIHDLAQEMRAKLGIAA